MAAEELRAAREIAVARMENALRDLKPGTSSPAAAALVMGTVFVGAALWITFLGLITFAFSLIKSPFTYVFTLLDSYTLLFWYTRRIARRMTGEE